MNPEIMAKGRKSATNNSPTYGIRPTNPPSRLQTRKNKNPRTDKINGENKEIHFLLAKLIDFFKSKNVNFVKILSQLPFEETAFDYDRRLRELFVKYEKKVAVVGIGNDLHTAGIFANSLAITSPKFVVSQVVNNEFPKRITMTLKTLKRFNAFIILTFGQEKKEALVRLLADKDGDINKYPALFFNKTAIKSFLITDVDL